MSKYPVSDPQAWARNAALREAGRLRDFALKFSELDDGQADAAIETLWSVCDEVDALWAVFNKSDDEGSVEHE